MRGNDGCTDCHWDPEGAKTRDTALACKGCHATMIAGGSVVAPPEAGLEGYASGYMDAMHGLCVTCHEQVLAEGLVQVGEDFARCSTCHHERRLPGPPMVDPQVLVAGNRSAAKPGAGKEDGV